MATYQVWVAPVTDTLGHFQAWAQMFGAALTTFGWVAQTGHGEVVATGTGASYAFTTPILPTAQLLPPNSYTFLGAFSNTTAYLGGNSNGFATEVDVVTSGGVTYQCIANSSLVLTSVANASGGSTVYTGTITGGGSNAFAGASFTIAGFSTSANNGTFVCTASSTTTLTLTSAAGVSETHAATAKGNPASNTVQWAPLQFEIWKSNGSNTSSLPIYLKMVYTLGTSTGFDIILSIGTGVDSNGNLINCVNFGNSSPPTVSPINPAGNTQTTGECDFSGDADNFRFILFRGPAAAANINFIQVLVIDRAKTATGADTDAYVYIASDFANGTAQAARSAVILNSALGAQASVNTISGWAGVVSGGGITSSTVMFGSAPVFPIFPIIGFLGNPILGAVGVHHDDYSGADGAIIPVYIYGATHNYLVSSQLTAQAASLDNQTANHGLNPAILWE